LLISVCLLGFALACNLPRTTTGENFLTPAADDFEFLPRPTEGPYADFPSYRYCATPAKRRPLPRQTPPARCPLSANRRPPIQSPPGKLCAPSQRATASAWKP
ncbi:MAG TPA: hypothetical protein VJ965_10615, partial [Anaerolineales bacterium]|nr:hypothetical protein [Anaerolineales bacterium]